jgi:hypothetical protein
MLKSIDKIHNTYTATISAKSDVSHLDTQSSIIQSQMIAKNAETHRQNS